MAGICGCGALLCLTIGRPMLAAIADRFRRHVISYAFDSERAGRSNSITATVLQHQTEPAGQFGSAVMASLFREFAPRLSVAKLTAAAVAGFAFDSVSSVCTLLLAGRLADAAARHQGGSSSGHAMAALLSAPFHAASVQVSAKLATSMGLAAPPSSSAALRQSLSIGSLAALGWASRAEVLSRWVPSWFPLAPFSVVFPVWPILHLSAVKSDLLAARATATAKDFAVWQGALEISGFLTEVLRSVWALVTRERSPHNRQTPLKIAARPVIAVALRVAGAAVGAWIATTVSGWVGRSPSSDSQFAWVGSCVGVFLASPKHDFVPT